MKIKLNGETQEIAEGMNFDQLLEQLGIENRNLAVEYNGDFLSENQTEGLVIKEGDTLEIVRFVGGG